MSWQSPVTRWQQLISACFKGGWSPSRPGKPPKLAVASSSPDGSWPSLPSGSSICSPGCGGSLVSHTHTACAASTAVPRPGEAGPRLSLPVPGHLTKPLALALAGSNSQHPTPAATDVAQLARTPGQAVLKATCTQMCSFPYPAVKPPQPHIFRSCNCAHHANTVRVTYHPQILSLQPSSLTPTRRRPQSHTVCPFLLPTPLLSQG